MVDGEAEGVEEWLGGEIETEAETEVEDSRLDAESREMIRTQRHYYDSVHRIKEKVRRVTMCDTRLVMVAMAGVVHSC